MKKILNLFLFVGVFIFLISLTSADTQTLTMNFIIPEDNTPPTIDCQNYTGYIEESFSQYLSATDVSGIDTYTLNETSVFTMNGSTGLITNNTLLNSISTYWLNSSVNDTVGNVAYCEFKISITTRPTTTTVTATPTCRYKKFGYYNLELPWMKQEGCI